MSKFSDFLYYRLDNLLDAKKNSAETDPENEIDLQKLYKRLVAEKENFQFKYYRYIPPNCLYVDLCYGRIDIIIDENIRLDITKRVDKKSAYVSVRVYSRYQSRRNLDSWFFIENREFFNDSVSVKFDDYDFIKLICAGLKNGKVEYDKMVKLNDMAAKSIEAVLAAELKDFRHQWRLRKNKDDEALLEIEIANNRIVSITIDYKDFASQKPPFVEKVRNIKKFVTNLEETEKAKKFKIIVEY